MTFSSLSSLLLLLSLLLFFSPTPHSCQPSEASIEAPSVVAPSQPVEPLPTTTTDQNKQNSDKPAEEKQTSTIGQNLGLYCPRDCSGNGKCFMPPGSTKAMCICERGWEDSDCSKPSQSVSSNLPSWWFVVALFFGVIAVERVFWLLKRCREHIDGRSTQGFSQLNSSGHEHEADLENESFNKKTFQDQTTENSRL